jgi:hypothetical protein
MDTWRSAVRSLMTALIVVTMAAPACAQIATGSGVSGVGGSGTSGNSAPIQGGKPSITLGGEQKSKSADELKYERDLDRAYKSGVGKIPDQKASSDAWGNLRSAATPPPGAKQQRPGSK